MAPELWDGKLAWMLWIEVLENDVQGTASDAQEVAAEGVEIGDDGAAFLPVLLLFEMDHSIWNIEVLAEAPFVSGA